MSIHGLDNVGVAVRRLEESLRFYQQVVGLELTYRDDASRSAALSAGGANIYLMETAGPDGPPRTSDIAANPTGVDHVSFVVDDVDATYAEVRARGGQFFMEPNDAEWGARVCGCRDPNGVPVYFLKWKE